MDEASRDDAPAAWSSGEVDVEGVRLHYCRTGGGKAPLVLAHGITADSHSWRGVAPHLAVDHDVITYDARGHGLSSAPPEGEGYEGMAEDLAGLMAALDIPTAAVIGHSMGAATAAVFAASHPELASRVVLEDPPWRSQVLTAAQREAAAESWRKSVAKTQTISLDERVQQLKRLRPEWTEEQWVACAEAEHQVDLGVFDLVRRGAPEWREVVGKFRCPALLLTGDPRAGAIVKPEVAREAMALCSTLKVMQIDGAGHNIHTERPGEFEAAVAAFLEEEGASGSSG